MGEEYSVAELARQVVDLRVQVGQLQTLQETNHKQNPTDIHDIRGILDSIVNRLTSIEIKNARWSVLAGIVTALLLKGLDHFIK